MKHPKTSDEYLIEPDLKVKLHGTEFPLEYLFRGLLTVGQPGAGKTRCVLMPLIREILRATGNQADTKCGLIVADPKNELASFLLAAAKEVGREEDVIILKPDSAWYNPLSSPFLTGGEVVEKIVSWSNNTNRNGSQRPRGEEAYWPTLNAHYCRRSSLPPGPPMPQSIFRHSTKSWTGSTSTRV